MRPPTLEQERFRLLLDQVAEEYGDGWQTRLARETGVSQTMFSKAASGVRQAGLVSIEKVRERMGIEPRFFHDPALKAPHYSQFRRRPTATRIERFRPAHFLAWKRAAEATGVDVPNEVEETMLDAGLRMGVHLPETWWDIHRIVIANRRGKAVRERGGESETAAAKQEAERLGLRTPRRRR